MYRTLCAGFATALLGSTLLPSCGESQPETLSPARGVESSETASTELAELAVVPLCQGHVPTIVGTAGDDYLAGTAGPDVIHGLGGDDYIVALGGDDIICGGPGNDVINAGRGHDLVFGGAGDDGLYGHQGDDELDGGDGMDDLYGHRGDDVLRGGAETDWLHGGRGRDILDGGEGADSLRGGAGNDTLEGGSGDDALWGGGGDDLLRGDAGADWLVGNAGDDTIEGGPGADYLLGGAGDDTLRGQDGDDSLAGGAGYDVCDGGPGDDHIGRSCESVLAVPPAVVTDLVVTSNDGQNTLLWTPPPGVVTQIEVLTKTGDCSFGADPDGSEAKGSVVGNATVLFNDDPAADLALTAVTVDGAATTVSYDATSERLVHGALTNGTRYCYRIYARNGDRIDDGIGGRPTVSGTPVSAGIADATWTHSASLGSLAAPSVLRSVGVFYGDESGRVFGVSQSDGLELFRPVALSDGARSGPVGTLPGDSDATLFVSSLNGDAYAIWATGPSQGSVRWSTEGIDGDDVVGGDQPLGDALGAAPAIAADLSRAFVATRNLPGAQNRLFSLDVGTGACAWAFNGSCAGATASAQLGAVSQSPLYDGLNKRLFVTSAKQGSGATVWALDANDTPASSRLLWSRDLGHTEAAATFDGLSRAGILVGTDAGQIYRLDATDGNSCWGSTADGCGSATGGEEAFCTDPAVEARAASCLNGSAIRVGMAQLFVGVYAGSIVFSTADGAVRMIDADGVQRWKTTVPGAGYPLVLRSLAGGKVYVGGADGRVHQLNLDTGVEEATRDTESLIVGDPGYDGVVNRLVVNTQAGKLHAFAVPF